MSVFFRLFCFHRPSRDRGRPGQDGRSRPLLACLLLAASAASLPGQRITVFSEFQRPRPDGEIFSADRTSSRREILSPALVRNGWLSLLFTVEAPPGEYYTIYIAQNPDATAKADVYQLEYASAGGEWVPDGLRPVAQPVQAVLGEGQKEQAYLLDIFLSPKASTDRFRLEIQLHAAGRWTIYPMEMRPMEVTVPEVPPLRGRLAPLSARADETVSLALRDSVCGDGAEAAPAPLENLRAVILRNTLQDLAIARAREREFGIRLVELLALAGGWSTKDEFCQAAQPAPRGPEWWLRVRGHLYQGLPLPVPARPQ